VFAEAAEGRVSFHSLPPPTDDDIVALAVRVARRTTRIVARHDDDAGDDEPPDALALAQADAVQLPLALSQRHAQIALKPTRSLCALVDGFSLHAATFVPSGDRDALERLLRYILRPAVSAQRISRRPDGRVELAFRKPDPSGRTSWVTEGPELLRRLAALIPPRRVHTVKYHGVFSSAHKLRARIVVAPAPDDRERGDRTYPVRPSRLCWSALLERVFGSEVTACPQCGDRLRVLAFITDPEVTAKILAHLHIPTEPIAVAPARAPPPAFDDIL
jgi:Putative transposase